MKSVKSWRDEALAKGWLVEFKEGSGKVAIFISHTCARQPPCHRGPCEQSTDVRHLLRFGRWWDRTFTDETNDPNDMYDKGAADAGQTHCPGLARDCVGSQSAALPRC